ncbi:ImmA/IrrE family metallo-endopeptidase [Furfurilactobacillus siliginis]|uniref:IrrE N-terminal-like domain-containing protein n=1 Tax=Furfurilactobacillus siliginis TaxID=348151 RepID=A0A510VMF5_9LACO|nr:ImmA/IrrE family metallo-endopeptidase [Furfurilactobacillus siliginis]GEK28118.1 hypothetical protein LSI01_04290 [Furfurilactobacillus siliginis]
MNINKITEYMVDKYHTAGPFQIAEKLNVQTDWISIDDFPLGKTIYDSNSPLILLNENIKNSSQRYFVMCHELGHVFYKKDQLVTTQQPIMVTPN